MPRSTYGEGSVWYEAKRDLWFGAIYFGPGNRPKVSSRDKKTMLSKLRALQGEKDQDLLVTGAAPVTNKTTGAWLDYWLEQVKRRVESGTHADYSKWVRLYLKPSLAHIPLRTLAEEDVEAMMSSLEALGISPKTIRLSRSVLIQALDLALRRDKVRRNVAKLTVAPKQSKVKVSDRLNAEGAKLVLKTLLYDRLYALALLVLSTGMRPGEVFNLRWADVNFRQASLRVSQAKTRAGIRSIPLTPDLLKALSEHKANQQAEHLYQRAGFVFVDEDGEKLKHRDITDWWHDALARAGLERRRFYATRHTAATLMLNNGVPLEVISKILGHASYAITSDIYAEVEEDLQRTAADVMQGVLG